MHYKHQQWHYLPVRNVSHVNAIYTIQCHHYCYYYKLQELAEESQPVSNASELYISVIPRFGSYPWYSFNTVLHIPPEQLLYVWFDILWEQVMKIQVFWDTAQSHMAQQFSLLKTSRLALGASSSRTTGVLSQGKSSWGVKLTTYLHLVPRLRMCGAIPLLPLYAFMLWKRTILHVPFM
jgi:hypothetical protein